MLLSPSALAAALLAEEQPETAATQRQLEELQAGEHSPSTLSARMRLLQQGRQTTQRERTLQRHLQEEASAAQSHPQTVGGGAVPQQRDSNTDSIQGTPTKKHPAAAATNTIAQSPLRGPPPLLIVDTSRPRPLSPWWSLGDGEENGSSGLVCPHEPGTSLWRAWVHECHSVFFRWYSFGRSAYVVTIMHTRYYTVCLVRCVLCMHSPLASRRRSCACVRETSGGGRCTTARGK
jgi:hypothetical protein